jgi:hypothetical protein
MPVEFENEYSIRDEQSPFKDMLQTYSMKLSYYGNILVIILLCLIPARNWLENKGIFECSYSPNDEDIRLGRNPCSYVESFSETMEIFF